MPDFSDIADGSRLRLIYEVDVADRSRHFVYDEEGTGYGTENLVSVEKLQPKLPDEIASVATFRFKTDGEIRQCVFNGKDWMLLDGSGDNILLNAHEVVSVDRVGV